MSGGDEGLAPPAWIDTHAHLDDDAFADDLDVVVEEAATVGVGTIVNIGYRPVRWRTTLALAERRPEIRVVLGIHPGHADEFDDAALSELAGLVERTRPVAIGEIGIDLFHRSNPSLTAQQDALRQQLRVARAFGLPAIIHQRAAEAELLDLIEREPDPPPLVLHSFDGGPRYAAFARERGTMVGVGGLATRSASASLRTLLAGVPPEQILLETDAPYLVPAGARGRRNRPANIPTIGRRLAPLWSLATAEFADVTTANARRAFSLATPILTLPEGP